jgi:hypothetical protein
VPTGHDERLVSKLSRFAIEIVQRPGFVVFRKCARRTGLHGAGCDAFRPVRGEAPPCRCIIGSQAGTQAIVDARVLAKALAASPLDTARALVDYEKDRLPVVTEVMLRNREYGPEIVMQMAEERAPKGFTSIEEIIPRHELETIARDFKIAAGFDPESLNRRPSLSVVGSRV